MSLASPIIAFHLVDLSGWIMDGHMIHTRLMKCNPGLLTLIRREALFPSQLLNCDNMNLRFLLAQRRACLKKKSTQEKSLNRVHTHRCTHPEKHYDIMSILMGSFLRLNIPDFNCLSQ